MDKEIKSKIKVYFDSPDTVEDIESGEFLSSIIGKIVKSLSQFKIHKDDLSNRVDVLEEKLENVSKDVEGVSKMLDLINGEVV